MQHGTHFVRDNIRQGGLAKPGRAIEEDMIERFVALFGGRDGDFEPILDLGLAGEIGEQRRAQRQFERGIGFVQSGNGAFGHFFKDAETKNQRQGETSETNFPARILLLPRSAELHSAVSRIVNPHDWKTLAVWKVSRPAECHSAIQQITKLRYHCPALLVAP